MIVEAVLCLALNIYHEARSSPLAGQLAVGFSTMNRVKAPNYPNDVCSVVFQARYNKSSKHPIKNKCHFSWWCDGISDQPTEKYSFKRSKALAKLMIEEGEYISVVGNNATHYHTEDVIPYWSNNFTELNKIGKHIFYTEKSFYFKPLARPEEIGNYYLLTN